MPSQSTQSGPSWCEASASNRALLTAAAQTWNDTRASSQYIQQALAQPDVELDVLVSAYRYYFYKNNDSMALEISTTLVDRIQKAEQWPTDWEALKPVLQAQMDHPMVRLYLNAYAASGLVLARLGSFECAQLIAEQVQQLEAKEFGAEVLLTILNPPAEDED